jgi:Ca2+-binding RTX toxin-like protein
MATIKGTNSGETKTGTTAADLIYGYGGNDKLYGRAGDDKVWGGLGDDQAWGEDGNDWLYGEDGKDWLWGGNGNDTIYGGIGDDSLYGDAGTDTIKGDAGNDTIKGGTGISYLYGGDGIDTLYYDPTTSDIDAVGNYLSPTYLEGEKVYIYNKSTDNGLPTQTFISNPDINVESHDNHLSFGSDKKWINVGYLEGNPEIVVIGDGGLYYSGPDWGRTSKITGTAVDDEFHGGYGNDIFKGLGGNDDFYINGGNDQIISETNDADRVFFYPSDYGTNATITGFNGAGVAGGDAIYLGAWIKEDLTISTANGKTTMNVQMESEAVTQLTVDKVGLVANVDYFFI